MGQHHSVENVLTHFFVKCKLYSEEFLCSAHVAGTEVLVIGCKERGEAEEAVQCGGCGRNWDRDLALGPAGRLLQIVQDPRHGFVQ